MFLLIMGVSGSGKSTLGAALADRLNWQFVEGDDLHPEANVLKMREGHALDDADRAPWLQAIAQHMCLLGRTGVSAVVTCSALKAAYRRVLLEGTPEGRLVYLRIAKDVAMERVMNRVGHFLPASLVASQFNDLEEPRAAERALWLDSTADVGGNVDRVMITFALL